MIFSCLISDFCGYFCLNFLCSSQENGLLPSVANNEQLCKVAEVQKGKKVGWFCMTSF